MPVLVAPMSAMLMAHKEGEPATARAAVAANTSMVCFFTFYCPTLTAQCNCTSCTDSTACALLVSLFQPEHRQVALQCSCGLLLWVI